MENEGTVEICITLSNPAAQDFEVAGMLIPSQAQGKL